MSDIFFEADANNPDHWRFYGREAFDAEVARVNANREPWMRTVGDLHRQAINNLKARRPAQEPNAGRVRL